MASSGDGNTWNDSSFLQTGITPLIDGLYEVLNNFGIEFFIIGYLVW